MIGANIRRRLTEYFSLKGDKQELSGVMATLKEENEGETHKHTKPFRVTVE